MSLGIAFSIQMPKEYHLASHRYITAPLLNAPEALKMAFFFLPGDEHYRKLSLTPLLTTLHILGNRLPIFQHNRLPDRLAVLILRNAYDFRCAPYAGIGIVEGLRLVGVVCQLRSLGHSTLVFLAETPPNLGPDVISPDAARNSAENAACCAPAEITAKIAPANRAGNAAKDTAETSRFRRSACGQERDQGDDQQARNPSD
jgi:hypothetical protein